jgi:glycosyltransferase involved in cell wall biosynthesis
MSTPEVTVLIRSKDEAPNIGKVLDILARQTIADRAETVVVDSGSTDGTVDIARAADVRLFEMPAEEFTYGRSLNLGCSNARGEIVVALSAHAYPWDEHWLERMVQAFDDEKVACACGYDKAPDGGELTGPLLQDEAHALRHPRYGYTNASGGFRAKLWRERPFREDLPMTEDKEWALHWMQRGWLCLVDPALGVDHTHGGESIRSTYGRAFLEYAGLAMYADVEPYGAGALAREWWRGDPAWPTALRARLSRRRAARLAGKYRGLRVADGAAVGGAR